jgi:acetolactate synthase-1/2/3 large subunit
MRNHPQRRLDRRPRTKPGRHLGYMRYDMMAEALGCYAEYAEEPEGIRRA